MADKTESPVRVSERDETVIGQPQQSQPAPHDGATLVRELSVHTDKVILDPNHPLAVQVPEGVGASTYGETSALGRALKDGTAEEQFAKSDDTKGSTDNKTVSDKQGSPKADEKK